MSDKIIEIPIEDVTTPKQGQMVIVNHWWVTRNNCVLGFKIYGKKSRVRPTPQCNTNKLITERLINRIYKDCDAIFLPVAYWENYDD